MDNDSRPLSRRARFEILRRDDFTCRYCGAKAPDVELTVDHVIPQALGGGNDPGNLVTACFDCNSGKGSTSPAESVVADVDEVAIRYADAVRRAAEIERAHRQDVDDLIAGLLDYWHPCRAPGDAYGSIEAFLDAGLSPDDITYAMDEAVMRGKPFKYFAGICWTMVRRRHELAVQIMEGN